LAAEYRAVKEVKKRNQHIGSSLEDFLKEEGVLEETVAAALKETLAWQVLQAMKKDKISKVEMARRLIVFSILRMPR
jgi:antitoxin HicB